MRCRSSPRKEAFFSYCPWKKLNRVAESFRWRARLRRLRGIKTQKRDLRGKYAASKKKKEVHLPPKLPTLPDLPAQTRSCRKLPALRALLMTDLCEGVCAIGESGSAATPSAAGALTPPMPVMSSPTRGLEVLAAAAAAPAGIDDDEDMELAGDALPPVASAVVDNIPTKPPSAFEQGEIIARQQQEIAELRQLVSTQASTIEQLRKTCMASAPGTSPPPLYGPSSPSTEFAGSEELDELSPTRQDREATRDPHAARPLSQPLQYPHATLHAAHAAAASLAAYASYDPRLGAISAPCDGRPASAASHASMRGPPTPNRLPKGGLPRTPNSTHSHFGGEVDVGGPNILKRMRTHDGSCAPSPSHHSSAPSLPFSAVTLNLGAHKTTISGPTGGGGGKRAGGGRTNTHVLWTPEEDTCLRALVDEHGEQAWALVASRMPHERNNKQCRERWRNHLRPGMRAAANPPHAPPGAPHAPRDHWRGALLTPHSLGHPKSHAALSSPLSLTPPPFRLPRAACNKGPWTEEEDRLILERVQQHGTKWAKISGLYLPDRPENDIKNRWHILIRMHQHSANGHSAGGLTAAGAPPALGSDMLPAALAAPPPVEALAALAPP